MRIAATLGVLGDFAKAIGGDHVVVEILSNPRQDPHYVQPRPTLNKRIHAADLFIEIGLRLELWAEQVVTGSGNPQIQRGSSGRCVASRGIGLLDRPTDLSRDLGDLHPDGNPHMWLDPVNARAIAANIAESMQLVDPMNAESYAANLERFERRLDVALFGAKLFESVGSKKLLRLAKQYRLIDWLERRGITDQLGGWYKRAEKLRGLEVVTYHKNWVYFAKRFGIEIPIEIESLGGIPPSARHRDKVLQLLEARDIKLILQAGFYGSAAAQVLAGESHATIVIQPIDCGSAVDRGSYFELIDGLFDGILAVVE